MEKDGVDRAVVFSPATAPHQVEVINRFIRDTCQENPSLIGVGTMHPDYPDFEGEVKRMKEFGLVGIKLHPDIVFCDGDVGQDVAVADKLRKSGVGCVVLYEAVDTDDLLKNL